MPKKKSKGPAPDSVFKGRDGSVYVFHGKLPGEVPEDADFAEKLRDAIRDNKISQYQLAKAADVPQGAISMFMNGGDLRLKTFNRLAYLMGFELRQVKSKTPKKRPPRPKK
jgi:hypothetical protein